MVDHYILFHLFKRGGRSEITFAVLVDVKDYDNIGVIWIQDLLWNQKIFFHCKDIDAQT